MRRLAACLSTDVDEEERAAQISSAHSQGGRCQAIQEGGVVVDAGGVCFPLAEEEEGYCGDARQGGGERRLIGLRKGGGGGLAIYK